MSPWPSTQQLLHRCCWLRASGGDEELPALHRALKSHEPILVERRNVAKRPGRRFAPVGIEPLKSLNMRVEPIRFAPLPPQSSTTGSARGFTSLRKAIRGDSHEHGLVPPSPSSYRRRSRHFLVVEWGGAARSAYGARGVPFLAKHLAKRVGLYRKIRGCFKQVCVVEGNLKYIMMSHCYIKWHRYTNYMFYQRTMQETVPGHRIKPNKVLLSHSEPKSRDEVFRFFLFFCWVSRGPPRPLAPKPPFWKESGGRRVPRIQRPLSSGNREKRPTLRASLPNPPLSKQARPLEKVRAVAT